LTAANYALLFLLASFFRPRLRTYASGGAAGPGRQAEALAVRRAARRHEVFYYYFLFV
jgi:hypothetical protein